MAGFNELLVMFGWLAIHGVTMIVLVVLIRRSRAPGMWLLFAAMGVWPLISFVFFRFGVQFLVVAYGTSFYRDYYWIPYLASAIVTAVLQIAAVAVIARNAAPIPSVPLCPTCGYNVTGLPDDRCPECGTRFVCELRYATRVA